MKKILCFILIITISFNILAINSYAASDDGDTNPDFQDGVGIILAGLGYVLDGTVLNGIGVSNILEIAADGLMDEQAKNALATNHGFSDWASMKNDDSQDFSQEYYDALIENQSTLILYILN